MDRGVELSSSEAINLSQIEQPCSAIGGRELRRLELSERISSKLESAQNILIWGAGGGADSVTQLLTLNQFRADFSEFTPQRITVAAMLPDVLDYQNTGQTEHPDLLEINSKTTRHVGGKRLNAFPEPLLAEYASELGLEGVYGVNMRSGSVGIAEALSSLIHDHNIDTVLVNDVGGDFIAVPHNTRVLSPMMDAYALYALRQLMRTETEVNFLTCVFGLGTDGESTPGMLHDALDAVGEYQQGTFSVKHIKEVETFYRNIIEPNRHSNTADLVLQRINGERNPNPVAFSARFHTRPVAGAFNRYYGEFAHVLSPEFAAKYYLFDDLSGIDNPFEVECRNGIEWFMKIQERTDRANQELNGQGYSDVQKLLKRQELKPQTLYFGTPSLFFEGETRRQIMQDIMQSVGNRVYDTALVFQDDVANILCEHSRLSALPVGEKVSLLCDSGNQELDKIVDVLSLLKCSKVN